MFNYKALFLLPSLFYFPFISAHNCPNLTKYLLINNIHYQTQGTTILPGTYHLKINNKKYSIYLDNIDLQYLGHVNKLVISHSLSNDTKSCNYIYKITNPNSLHILKALILNVI